MTLTIFTPTYNRAATLPRLYESLLSQTATDFEWLLVDDGSTDETAQLVTEFTGEGRFPVRYHRKENGGKHTAYNLGLELAQGDYFFCVDSDDLLAPEAVQKILDAASRLDDSRGIVAYKQDLTGKRLSGEFPSQLDFCQFHELSTVHGCSGEFSLIFPTALAKRYPFPVFEGERFVTESVVYDRISPVCPMLLLPAVVTLCEYQQEGYSSNANAVMARNPAGYCLYFMQRMDVLPSVKGRMISAGKYWCFRFISGNQTLKYRGKHRLLWLAGWPLGVLFRIYYKVRRGI
jgi:glycosyltransferase involved in cell wall biosynthesis